MSALARAIVQHDSHLVRRLKPRPRLPDVKRPTSANRQRFIHSPSIRRTHKDDEAVPFDSATKKLEISPVPRRHLEIELRWYPDRVKFAQHIRELLYKSNNPAKALALLRLKSKPDDPLFCTVAWNHVLNYHLDQGFSARAFELFNDMKKRGQSPDSMTYLILLRKLVKNDDKSRKPSQAHMTRVVNVFESMFAPKSKVEPTTAHADAALIAVSSDVEKAWQIIALLPEDGTCAPQLSTYTAILRAVKESMYSEAGSTEEERSITKAAAIERSRDIWSIVVKRWKAGKIKLDEGLVLGMANVLLRSPHMRDWDDILNLVQQTANVPRQLSAIGTAERNTAHVPTLRQREDQADPDDDLFQSLDVGAQASQRSKRNVPRHIRPTAKLLTVLLKACLKMRTPRAASDYWHYFTQQAEVVPDNECVIEMLNICSINRSSAKAAEILNAQLSTFHLPPDAQAFRHALKACQRNVKAKTSMVHAGEIVKLMAQHSTVPNVDVLIEYMSLAKAIVEGDRIAQAINNIDEPLQSLRTILTRASFPKTWTSEEQELYQRQAIALYNSLISAMDLLTSRKLVPEEQLKTWSARRTELIAFTHPLRQSITTTMRHDVTSSSRSDPPEVGFGRRRARRHTRAEIERHHDNVLAGISNLPMSTVGPMSYAST